jgi:hypothetical protein
MPYSSDPTQKKYRNQKSVCEGKIKYCAFCDASFCVSELIAFVLDGRPGAFFFLLGTATGLLSFSTSNSPLMKNNMRAHVYMHQKK